mmetsp:Transcript_71832/g.191702  ORF Transcript_71832/g.191702 Transcript_71832/m.191702 type:complete len:207 (-) Transcript_71832:1428-2048(-)
MLSSQVEAELKRALSLRPRVLPLHELKARTRTKRLLLELGLFLPLWRYLRHHRRRHPCWFRLLASGSLRSRLRHRRKRCPHLKWGLQLLPGRILGRRALATKRIVAQVAPWICLFLQQQFGVSNKEVLERLVTIPSMLKPVLLSMLMTLLALVGLGARALRKAKATPNLGRPHTSAGAMAQIRWRLQMSCSREHNKRKVLCRSWIL